MIFTSTILIPLCLAASPSQDDERLELRRFVESWCVDCHEGARAKSDLDLVVTLDRIAAGETPASLERIIDRLRRGDMPPEGEPRPDEADFETVIGLLDGLVDRHAEGTPGRATVRRLGRHEYANTARDLLGVELSIENELPADEIGDGFDNNGDALTMPPLLLEKYFTLAESIAHGVIADPEATASVTRRYRLDDLRGTGRSSLKRSIWFLPTRGGVLCDHAVPVNGTYIVRAAVRGQQAGPEPVMMGIAVDGTNLERFPVETGPDVTETIELELELRAGSREIGVVFTNDYFKPDDPDPAQRDRNAFVEWVEVEGPIGDVYPTTLQAALLARYGAPDRPGRVRAMIRHLADRAWRRPVDVSSLDRLLELTAGEAPGWSRVRTALVAILVHPRFLFKIEAEPEPGDPFRRLDGWEIATRLSYFLWSTMPDEPLRRAAATGELDTPEGRARQVRRMIRDPRSRNLAMHFATQWLQIRTVRDAIPDDELFAGVDERLLGLMSRETERYFDDILRTDQPLHMLLEGGWTWLNQPLADHYGIEGVRGNRMRKVRLTPEGEAGTGILRHGSILVSTSNPTRTSPVKRGKWVLEVLLDDAPPPPPPGISGLAEDGISPEGLTLREQLVLHRADPECAACHVQMDALGFALEPFDAVGRPRTEIGGRPIDALGELPDGRLVDGPRGLRDVLLEQEGRRRFERSLARHLATYALGRGLDRRDESMLRELVDNLQEDPTLRRLIGDLVETDAFLTRPAANDDIMETGSTP